MKKLGRKAKFILFVLILSFSCVTYVLIMHQISVKESKEALRKISERTGLQEDWLAVREYVYCDLLKPGTSLEEVEKGLQLIGEYNLYGENSAKEGLSTFDQHINFKDGPTYYNLSPMVIIFDENKRLSSSGALEFNHGPRASCELERGRIARTAFRITEISETQTAIAKTPETNE